jgi:hypothetical protein
VLPGGVFVYEVAEAATPQDAGATAPMVGWNRIATFAKAHGALNIAKNR